MVANVLKGMIVGSRPHTARETTTMKRHDYGLWMCVPMNVPNRPTMTIKLFEWHYAVGGYSDTARQTMVAEEALSSWCKATDALGQIYIAEFRTDCAAYVIEHNKKFQIRLLERAAVP